MKEISSKRKKRLVRIASFLVILVLAGILWGRVSPLLKEDLESRRVQSIQEAVENAAFQCYSIEGVYPETLSYLEDNYGLMINHERYIVSYDCYASNKKPEIMVLTR